MWCEHVYFLSMHALTIQLWYFFHSVCLYLTYKKCVHGYISRETKKLEKVGGTLFWPLLSKKRVVKFVLVVFLFTVLIILSTSVCQWPQSRKDHQVIKKQLMPFSSLPSLCIWILFCNSLLGFIKAYPMTTDS